MSATTYEFTFRRQETVNLKRDGRMVTFDIEGTALMTLDILLGRLALHNPKSIGTLQKKNCFNRFFHLAKAGRYVAENGDEGLVVKDRRTGLVVAAHATKVTITLPAKSIWHFIAGIPYGNDASILAVELIQQYNNEQEARKTETVTTF